MARQQQYEAELMKEMNNTYMLFDDEVREWYNYACTALRFASPVTLNLRQKEYLNILEIVDDGINLNNVAWLANNLERTSPDQLGISIGQFQRIIKLNIKIADAWREAVKPVENLVKSRMNFLAPNKLRLS